MPVRTEFDTFTTIFSGITVRMSMSEKTGTHPIDLPLTRTEFILLRDYGIPAPTRARAGVAAKLHEGLLAALKATPHAAVEFGLDDEETRAGIDYLTAGGWSIVLDTVGNPRPRWVLGTMTPGALEARSRVRAYLVDGSVVEAEPVALRFGGGSALVVGARRLDESEVLLLDSLGAALRNLGPLPGAPPTAEALLVRAQAPAARLRLALLGEGGSVDTGEIAEAAGELLVALGLSEAVDHG